MSYNRYVQALWLVVGLAAIITAIVGFIVVALLRMLL